MEADPRGNAVTLVRPSHPPLSPFRGRRNSRVGLQRLWSTWLLGKLLAAALVIGALRLLQYGAAAPELNVASLLVMGNELVSAEEIAESLALQNTNIFVLRGRHLQGILKRNPAIEDATIHLRLPDMVVVAIQERTPAAIWDTGTQQLLVNAEGLVFRDAHPPGGTTPGLEGARGWAFLPTLHAPAGPSARVGERVDQGAVQIAAKVADRLDELALGAARLEYQPAAGVSVVAPGSYRVALGGPDHLEAKLRAYEAIREHLRLTRTSAQIIDVRSLENPYFH